MNVEEEFQQSALERCLLRLEALLDQRGWHDGGDARLWLITAAPDGRLAAKAPGNSRLHRWTNRAATEELYQFGAASRAAGVHPRWSVDVIGYAWSMEGWAVA